MAYSVTQNLILYKSGASNILRGGGQMATTVIVGWFAGRSLIIKISCIRNCHNYCVYFCNMCAIYICGRPLQIGYTRQKTLKRFHATGKIRTENFANQNHPRFTGMVTTTAGWLGNSFVAYSFRNRRDCLLT